MGARAGIVVTGTEVLTGRVADLNGPWLAEQLRLFGVDIAHIMVVGDRPDDLHAALEFMIGAELDLVITSGGLGPTADDLTAEVVARVQGRDMVLDAELEQHIEAVVRRLTRSLGWTLDPADTAAAVHKQAIVPRGASVLTPVGTAPGLIVPAADGRSGPAIVVLPGPPREVHGMWPAALADPNVQLALAGHEEVRQQTIRLWGTPESELSATLRELAPRLNGLEITTCMRGGELEIVTRYGPDAQPAYEDLSTALHANYPATLFSDDGRSVEQIVADSLLASGLTISTAESCTAGLLAGRLTDLAGSSAYVLGGLVVYSNEAKHELAGVDRALIESVGAVSPEVALALAQGARARVGTDIGVGITGVAGPGGGTVEKPVGLVYLCVVGPDRTIAHRLMASGSRADVRQRSVAVALHMVRMLLTGAHGESER